MQALSWYFTTCSVYTILGKKNLQMWEFENLKKKRKKRKLEAGHTKTSGQEFGPKCCSLLRRWGLGCPY